MQLNPDTSGTVKFPRLMVKVGPALNDQKFINGALTAEVNNTSRLAAADQFHVTFAVSELPPDLNLQWFSSSAAIFVSIYMGDVKDPNAFGFSDLTQFITGRVDSVEYNPMENTISISGRDLTGLLIDTKSTVIFVNQKSSQIAATIAQKHGLTGIVTATTTKAGQFSEIDTRQLFDMRSDWEVLKYLADIEDFIVYVRNQVLYFGPDPADSAAPYVYAPYVIKWQAPAQDSGYATANVQSIDFTRNKAISKGAEVVVMSWNPHAGRRFVGWWPLKPTDGQTDPNKATFGDWTVHRRTIVGLTQEQCDQKAQSLYEQIMQHEMKLSVELPGDVLLATDTVIQVTGTGTAYDQLYYPSSITRRFGWDGGFSMSVTATNKAESS